MTGTDATCTACGETIDIRAGVAAGIFEHMRLLHPDDHAELTEGAGETRCIACGRPLAEGEPYGMRVIEHEDGWAHAGPACMTCEAADLR